MGVGSHRRRQEPPQRIGGADLSVRRSAALDTKALYPLTRGQLYAVLASQTGRCKVGERDASLTHWISCTAALSCAGPSLISFRVVGLRFHLINDN